MDTFRFRLNCIDHYQAVPTELDPVLRRGQSAPHVPVIRVFGATETGQKVCAHIHGALPYLYIDYHGSLDKNAVNEYMRSLRASIDHALAATHRRNAYDGKSVYVGHITLVKGIPFYGYHVGYSFFLKIYLLNPAHMTRFADLLHQGAILDRVFQPYESHLQFLLQWMCDYNLYGCAYVDCAKVQFRGPVPASDILDTTVHKWHDTSIAVGSIAVGHQYPRQSHCALEVDVCVQDILNRGELRSRPLHHNFFEKSFALKEDEKYVPSLASLWKDETLRRKRRMGLVDPLSSPFPPEVLVSMSAGGRETDSAGWIHEKEYRELLEKLIRDETHQTPVADKATMTKPAAGENYVQTAHESVEDLYPANLATHVLFEDANPPFPFAVPKPESEFQGAPPNETLVVDDMHIGGGFVDYLDANQKGADESTSLAPLSLSEAQMQEQCDENEQLKNHLYQVDYTSDVEPGDNSSQSDDSQKRSYVLHSQQQGERSRFTTSHTNVPRLPLYSVQNDEDHKEINEQQTRPSRLGQGSLKTKSPSTPRKMSLPLVGNHGVPETSLRLRKDWYPNSQNFFQLPATKAQGLGLNPNQTSQNQHVACQHLFSLNGNKGSPGNCLSPDSMALYQGKSTTRQMRTLHYVTSPPSTDSIKESMLRAGLPHVLHQNVYYSEETDAPERPREYASRKFLLQSTSILYLPLFDFTRATATIRGQHPVIFVDKKHADSYVRPLKSSMRHWELEVAPPSQKQVDHWLCADMTHQAVNPVLHLASPLQRRAPLKLSSQIEGPTQKNKHGFKYAQKQASTSVQYETQYMSILSLEIHANSREGFAPDPAQDEIQAVFWCVYGEKHAGDDRNPIGILILSAGSGIVNQIRQQTSVAVEAEQDELDLINRIVDIVRFFDPDILTGYEVHNSSWGYLIERARLKFQYDLCDELSRTKTQSHGRFGKDVDRWGFSHTSTIRVTGRHMINIWRAMRGELNLLQYTMENVAFHLLHKRIPHYPFSDITAWYKSSKPGDLAKVIDYFITRVQLNLDILEANETVPRTSEQARLLGVDFFSVISRGSQFKVESTMFRIAKPENFLLVSPSRKQVGQQNALECLPLVMEPQSAFYPGPLLVLDFQSLYPSVMIAYNYCYSTCLGRVSPWRDRNKLGFTDFERKPGWLDLVKDHVNIAPNGIMYVRSEIRKSLLAKMLGEILETRVMVKSGMKTDKDDKALQQLLNNRQLALKLLANVTYGYTSASFSGRMPCSEIADSIVQTGREILEKAIALIHSRKKWGAEVVYGDTDSLFVYLQGRTRDQAFTIGEEIAEAVTKTNPRPIKLKFEKVYQPCVLLAKKRYVGFKYESRYQQEPEFEAKGIETIRRDGTPAEQKIEEKALKILFRTSDLTQVKNYFVDQCAKIMEGRVSIQDFLFAKEVKLGTYSDLGLPPPGALIATKRMLVDPRAEPQYGERVPYVVVTGAPNARLIDRCVSPETLLRNDHIELDAEYYILKNLIPPLERIFNLVGANIRQWYDEMPKVQRIRNITIPLNNQQPTANTLMNGSVTDHPRTLEGYLKGSNCIVCRSKLPLSPHNLGNLNMCPGLPVCNPCLRRPARALLGLKDIIWEKEKRVKQIDMICRGCSGVPFGDAIRCDSQDCPVFYARIREKSKLNGLDDLAARVVETLEEEVQTANVDGREGRECEVADDRERDVGEGQGVRGQSSGDELDW